MYGPTPAPLVIRRLSPRPNKNSPNTKNTKVNGLGFKLKESSELQTTLGIFLMVKTSLENFIDGCSCKNYSNNTVVFARSLAVY